MRYVGERTGPCRHQVPGRGGQGPRRHPAATQLAQGDHHDPRQAGLGRPREAGRATKERVLRHLDTYLVQIEESVTAAGGRVHWARDAEEANRIVAELVQATGEHEVIKIKSLTTDEIDLNLSLIHI